MASATGATSGGATAHGAADIEMGNVRPELTKRVSSSDQPSGGSCCTKEKCCNCFHPSQVFTGSLVPLGAGVSLAKYYLSVWSITDKVIFSGGIYVAVVGIGATIMIGVLNTNRNLVTAAADVKNAAASVGAAAEQTAITADKVGAAAGLLVDQTEANEKAESAHILERDKQIARIGELTEQLGTLTKERDAEKASGAAAVKERDTALQELVKLKGVFEQLAEAAKLSGQKAEVSITTMAKMEDELKRDLGNVQAASKQLSDIDAGAKAHKEGLITLISSIKNAISEKSKQLEAQQKQIETLSSQVGSLDAAGKIANSEADRLKLEISALATRKIELEEMQKRQVTINADREKELTELKTNLASLDERVKKYTALRAEVKLAQEKLAAERAEFEKAKAAANAQKA